MFPSLSMENPFFRRPLLRWFPFRSRHPCRLCRGPDFKRTHSQCHTVSGLTPMPLTLGPEMFVHSLPNRSSPLLPTLSTAWLFLKGPAYCRVWILGNICKGSFWGTGRRVGAACQNSCQAHSKESPHCLLFSLLLLCILAMSTLESSDNGESSISLFISQLSIQWNLGTPHTHT